MDAEAVEKGVHPEVSEVDSQDGGIHVTAEGVALEDLKTTKDGTTILIPQPSDDPEDPLNWSWSKKHLVLLSLLFPALLTDFGMTYGTTVFNQQAATWHMTVGKVANSLSGGIFLQGPGGVLAVPFAQRYGRLPVIFWSQFLSCMMVIGASQAKSYAGFTALRTLQGFFNTSPQVIGLSIVGDMFFFHERTKRINLWAFSFIVGPFFAPFCSALIVRVLSWRDTFAVLAGLYAFSTLLVVVLGDETLYDRHNPQPRPKGFLGRIKLLTGVTGFQQASAANRVTLGETSKHILRLGAYPNVFAVTAGYFMLLFMWAIGIVTTVAETLFPPPYLFSTLKFALFYLGPTTGAIIGELWGHGFNEVLRRKLTKKHRGTFVPEWRLWGCYPSFIVAFAGLILYGQTIQHSLSWWGLCIGWAMLTFGMVSGTTAVSAYLLDSYREESALVSGILNFWRTTGGFCVSYFQAKWIAHNGAGTSFGIQAGILGAGFCTIILTQIWGRGWRLKQKLAETS